MRLSILQACRYSELKPMITSADSWISLLGRHHYKEGAVNKDRHVDRALIVVRIPGKARNKITISDIMVALVVRRGTCATCGSRSIQREICICPSEFHRDGMWLSVLQARGRMEDEPMVWAP